jgi:integrase/recombinase XerD
MKTMTREIDEYLRLRRGMGFKLEVDETHLRRFAAFLAERKTNHITTELALEFACANEAVGVVGRVGRLVSIRGFARHLHAFEPKHEIPPTGLIRRGKTRAKPRLCSKPELSRLLATALDVDATETRGLRPWTLHALFGLLAVTGMRVGEAITLRRGDVNWEDAVLTIRGGKFGKSRMVPVHGTTLKVLRDYARRRDRHLREGWRGEKVSDAGDLFFVSNRGTALSGPWLRASFRVLLQKSGLAGAGRPSMRIHDLRHRFAVETLRTWYRQKNCDVESRLPALSTLLGHVNVAATYWYLSSTPALRAAAASRLETRWKGVADDRAQ